MAATIAAKFTHTVLDSHHFLEHGTWETISPYELGFYSVMTRNKWAFYYVDPYQNTGNWNTIHLGTSGGGEQFEISHLSGLAKEGTPVPEPATMLLLGFGLIGLAVAGRKNFRK